MVIIAAEDLETPTTTGIDRAETTKKGDRDAKAVIVKEEGTVEIEETREARTKMMMDL